MPALKFDKGFSEAPQERRPQTTTINSVTEPSFHPQHGQPDGPGPSLTGRQHKHHHLHSNGSSNDNIHAFDPGFSRPPIDQSSVSPRDVPYSKWLNNKDLRPTPVEQRTWGLWTSYLFWFSAAANLSNWYSPTSFMTTGLTMWESLGCHLVGQFVSGVTMALSGRPGAVYHVGYPVIARSSFGWLGAVWPVIQRVAMSIIWNGVNLVQGGQCVYVMLHAIFPSIPKLPNGLSKDDALDTGGMIGMLIFFAFLILALWFIPIYKYKYYLLAKVPVFAISAVSMLVWTLTLSNGLPHDITTSRNGIIVTPSQRKWLLLRFMFLSWANNSTFIVTSADLQRYTTRPNNAIFGQVIGFPISNFIIGLIGVIVGATSVKVIHREDESSTIKVGEIVWNPVVYLDKLQTQSYTPANRAGAFLLAFCFAYCGLFSCVVENLLPAGNDLSALWPKYLTIKRCFIICSVLSYACVPWKLLGTANHFISWLASYQIFLSSIAGIMLCHYFLISGGLMLVEPDLYSTSKVGVYNYIHGINFRACIAYILGIAPNFYGFLGQLGLHVSERTTKYYYFAYPVGLAVSFITYFILNIYFPPNFSTIEFFEDHYKPRDHDSRPLNAENDKHIEKVEGVKVGTNKIHQIFTDDSNSRDKPQGWKEGSINIEEKEGDREKDGLEPQFVSDENQRNLTLGPGSITIEEYYRNPYNQHIQNHGFPRAKFLGIVPKFRFHWREPYDYISPEDPYLQTFTDRTAGHGGLYYNSDTLKRIMPRRKRWFSKEEEPTRSSDVSNYDAHDASQGSPDTFTKKSWFNILLSRKKDTPDYQHDTHF